MKALIDKAWEIRKTNFPDEIEFDYPAKTKAVSVTGSNCGLKCAHCNGHYLEKMVPIIDWQKGLSEDTTSCLISGGCDDKGKVPLSRYLPLIKDIRHSKRRTNLHVGLLDDDEIDEICKVADVISFDFVGDAETVKEVYGLDKGLEEYIHIFKKLKEKVTVLPHICIGLRGGRISGEYKALEALKGLDVEGLVFIVFSPTEGTNYADKEPPKLEEVAKIFCKAREEFPNIPIHLGCMKPKGKYRAKLDELAVQCGLNKIVQPTSGAVETAKALGLVIKRGEECCVL